MTDFAPVSVCIDGDEALGQAFIPAAKQLLARLQMRMGQAQVLRAHQTLSEDAYCYAIIAPGLQLVKIVAGPPAIPVDPAWISEDWKTPDFLSGVVIGGQIQVDATGAEYCHEFLPTPDCGRLYKLYANNRAGPVPSKRLAVHPNPALRGGYPEPIFGVVPSQTLALKPTLWSGRMAKVVQALMGYGRPSGRSLYSGRTWVEDTESNRELRKARRRIAATAYEQRVASLGRQIRYDFQFHRTHGVTTASDGKLWLVEISMTRGVVVMPLPIYPETQKPEFRKRVEKLNDPAGLTLLDEFGGFPSGEPFPEARQFQAWVRAGRVIRPNMNLNDFYTKQPYSTVLGWAFSPEGNEAHNTCFQYGDDGVMRGHHYAVTLSIGATRAPERSATAANALAAPYQSMEDRYPERFEAAVWKLRYLTADQVNELAARKIASGTEAAFLYLDGLVLPPLASVSAPLSLVETGNLWAKEKNLAHPQIKFPEPALGFLMSFDMSPTEDSPVEGPVACDTTLHVCYQGNELHVVRFYRDGRAAKPVTESDFEECMYVGSWRERIDNGKAIPYQFYTTALDFREEVAPYTRTTDIVGKDLGYLRAYFTDDISYPPRSWMYREKWFRHDITIETLREPRHKTTVLVPFGDRSAYYFGHFHGYNYRDVLRELLYPTVTDPNWAMGYRKLAGYGQDKLPECGNHDKRRAAEIYYTPGPCTDVADSGPWISKCQAFEDLAYANIPPQPPYQVTYSETPLTLEVWLVAEWTNGPLLLHQETRKNDSWWDGGAWFTPSPDNVSGFTAYLHHTQNVLGETKLAQYYAEINGGITVKPAPPRHPDMEERLICCVGVLS